MTKKHSLGWLLSVILSITIIPVVGQESHSSSLMLHEMESPAHAGSAEPNLSVAADGRVFLTWIEPAGVKQHALRFAILNKDRWSAPRTIAEGTGWFVNWADFPSLVALPDGQLVAHWLVKSGDGAYAYNVNLARSLDDGKTWSKPVVPHRDGTQTEHGFVSLLAWTKQSTGVVWLDGRKFTAKEHGQADHGSATDEMTLRFTTLGSTGQLADEVLLDSRVCECCQTSAAMTSEGAVIVYRDRSEKEVRDIFIVRFHKGKWSKPQAVYADGWEIQGCPVNGPSVAAAGRRVAVAWFTGANNTPRVKIAFSNDAGATFNQPIQVDAGKPLGRVQTLMLADGSALVSWMEQGLNGAEIRVRRISANGSRHPASKVAESSSARSSGFPRMTRIGNEVVFAWTQTGSPSRVRTLVAKLETIAPTR